MRRLILVIPLCLLFIAVALSVDGSFYVSLLERGKAHFAEGAYSAAAKELRIAAFGLLDDIPKYETAHLYLALTHQRLGNTDLAALSVRKLYDAERVTRNYPTLPIDASARRSFEQLAASVLTREEFAILTRTTPSPAQEATTPSTTTSRIEPAQPSSADADRIAAERREQERIAAQRREQERIAAQRSEEERIAAQRREEERAAAQRSEQERLVAQREEERISTERRDAERAAALRKESERIAAERIAAERREKERIAAQRRNEEQASARHREEEQTAAQRREEERLAAEREEQRVAAQRREEERLAAEREEQRVAAQRREEEQRTVAERQEQEQAAQRREAEPIQAQRREQERLEAQRTEAERLDAQRREEAPRAAVPAIQQPVRVQVRPTAQRASLSAEIRRQLDAADRALEQGNVEQARNIYVRLLNSASLPRAALLEVARGLYQTADFRGVVEAFSRIGALRAGEEDFHYYAAVALFETGNFAAAYKQLLCALPFIRVTDDVTRYRAKIEGMIN